MVKIIQSAFYTMTFILFFFPLFFGFVSPVYALNVTLQWVPNSEPNLAGYKVFSREEGQSYNYANPYWELIDTTCTIYDLNETKTYYFVVRAFSTNNFESGDSNEVCLESTPVPVNKPPIADFSYATSGRKRVAFTDLSTDSEGTIMSRFWAFGDGKTSTKKNPNHRYLNVGNYSITLTVTDDGGVSNSTSKTIFVTK
jgi:PKD repeat protein